MYADIPELGQHGSGHLTASHYDHGSNKDHPRHHHGYLPWAILTGILSFIAVGLVFKVIRHWQRRHHRSKGNPTLASQLSELSSQSDIVPNPLLANARPTMAVQAAGVMPKADPEWMGNVPWSDWQIDQEDILLCRRPDGRLWELGAGASAKVSHVIIIHCHHLHWCTAPDTLVQPGC